MMPGAESSSRVPRRVLIADPDADARGLYRQALWAAGSFEIVEALDGRDALVKSLVRVPALVVTELRLPVLDGFALCDILRSDRTTAATPILAATTETNADTLDRARRVADVVLRKPTPVDVVRMECERLLEFCGHARQTCTESDDVVGRSATVLRTAAELQQRLRPAVKAQLRFTTTSPPAAPPALSCPDCKGPLTFELSYIGGVNARNLEQWDYFICVSCGTFQYRQRTRGVRRLRADEEQWLERLRAMRTG